jgi:hypothetical protein
MDAHYSVDLTDAFVGGPNELTKLVELLENYIGKKVKIRADCSDGVSRSFSHVRELVNYENPKSKEIRKIHLTARSDDFSKSASIDLTDSKWQGISLDFTAGDESISRLVCRIRACRAGPPCGSAGQHCVQDKFSAC